MQFGYPTFHCPDHFGSAVGARSLILAGLDLSHNFVLAMLYDFYGKVHDANHLVNEHLRQVIRLLRNGSVYAGALPVSHGVCFSDSCFQTYLATV